METFHVLLIDSDEETIRKMTKRFSGAGARVETQSDAGLALEQIKAEPPDLIIVSAELPSTSGYSLINKLKKGDATGKIPTVLISRTATEETFLQHQKLKTAADAYLLVPFSDKKFLKAMNSAAPHLARSLPPVTTEQ
ncbi:response regulator [Myxococcota bacterium]|nr:response regulator [Myxococcota bacterium]MBU1535127.1 response regulator [Myxococcota bacterium]